VRNFSVAASPVRFASAMAPSPVEVCEPTIDAVAMSPDAEKPKKSRAASPAPRKEVDAEKDAKTKEDLAAKNVAKLLATEAMEKAAKVALDKPAATASLGRARLAKLAAAVGAILAVLVMSTMCFFHEDCAQRSLSFVEYTKVPVLAATSLLASVAGLFAARRKLRAVAKKES